jgi:hypothetical protein
MQKHRILTQIGNDQRVTVELKQDFDLLEILSLKFTQQDAYTSLCSDYGVVCGRIGINNGFGIPNARDSIFIPQSEIDQEDPVISTLYPYTSTEDRNENNYRYNLLPSRKQHSGHTPTGTFFDQKDILTREEVLEVYEKYYKYTVKTNDSGDFMIWGVPLGSQTLHVDIDLSDMGCQSLVPFDLIYEGISEEKFENKYTFLSSENLDSLPQILSFDKTIEVYPFWGNQSLCEVGLTRTDFDLGSRGVRLEPYSLMMGGTVTDSGKDALRVNCNVDNQMGEKCRLTTFEGDIEAIRFTGNYQKNEDGSPNMDKPILERFAIDSTIDENGVFFFRVPMNTHYIYTNEFGENVISRDAKLGIPTKGTYRFRFSLNEDSGSRNKLSGKILVPNIREYHINDTFLGGSYNSINPKSYSFSTNIDDYPTEALKEITGTSEDAIRDGKIGIPQDYFYQFRYGRTYSVSQFINKYYKTSALERAFSFFARDRRESFVGIKEIWPSEKEDCSTTNNYFPINDAVRNNRFNFFILTILNYIEFIILRISLFIKEFVAGILFFIADLMASVGVLDKASARMYKRAKEFQFNNIFKLNLITYPDCYDCTEDESDAEFEIITNPVNSSYYTGTTATNSNFYFGEKYLVTRPSGCDLYTFTNGGSSDITFSFLNCDNISVSYEIFSGDTISICGVVGQSTPAGLTLDATQTDGCSGTAGANIDFDLYFRPTGSGFPGFSPLNLPTQNQGAQVDGAFLYQHYLIEIDIVGGQSLFIPIGLGQTYPIVWDSYWNTWKVKNLYSKILDDISNLYNVPVDSVVPNTCHDSDGYVLIKKIWLVKSSFTSTEYVIREIETGCSKYDYIIDDSRTGNMFLKGIVMPINGLNFTANTYKDVINYYKLYRPINQAGGVTGPHRPNSFSNYMWNQLDDEYNSKILGTGQYAVTDCEAPLVYDVAGVASVFAKFPTTNSGNFINKDSRCIKYGQYFGQNRITVGVDYEPTENGTLTGWSEFRDGVYTIVPLAGRTGEMLNSYRRRKLFGKLMCGGVISYVFTNSWLNGVLYFFQFMKRGSNRFCKDCVYRKVESDGKINFYYRSTPYNSVYSAYELQSDNETNVEYSGKTKGFYGVSRSINYSNTNKFPSLPSYAYLLGDVSNRIVRKREINFPTTIIDLGPRSTWIKEICVDPEFDVNCSITRSIGSTSYKGIDDLMEYIIQSKEIKERGKLDVQDLFDSRGFGLIDGDIAQLINFNTQAGIFPFEYEEANSPYTDLYSATFDSKGPVGIDLVFSEDDPDTTTVESNGYLIRKCLNSPGKLGDNSQIVPYYMWDTRGHGFGESRVNSGGERQSYYTGKIYSQRIQEIKANLNADLNIDPTDNNYFDPYVLPPIRDCIDVNGTVTKSNDNYKEYRVNGQIRHLMEIGTPFHFMFGLRKGKSSFDKFLESFGPQ